MVHNTCSSHIFVIHRPGNCDLVKIKQSYRMIHVYNARKPTPCMKDKPSLRETVPTPVKNMLLQTNSYPVCLVLHHDCSFHQQTGVGDLEHRHPAIKLILGECEL